MAWAGIIRTMRERMPWQAVGHLLLSENEISRSSGWDKTVARLQEDEAAYADKLDTLVDAVKEHLCCGEKLVSFYDLDRQSIDDVQQRISHIEIPPSVFRDSYPENLPVEDLPGASLTPSLTAVEQFDLGTACIFSSVRTLTVRDTFTPGELNGHAQSVLSAYDEIIAVRKTRFQASDVVWIPNNGEMIDVLIDFPDGMYLEQATAYQTAVAAAFDAIIGLNLLGHPANLFPVIERLYDSADDGIVVELGFNTTTASVKNEKMRRRTACLRRESYHKGGKAALTTAIEPFKISVVWAVQRAGEKDSHPELSLNSNMRTAGLESPVLTNAVVRSCVDLADYDYVRSRISTYLHLAIPELNEQEDDELAHD